MDRLNPIPRDRVYDSKVVVSPRSGRPSGRAEIIMSDPYGYGYGSQEVDLSEDPALLDEDRATTADWRGSPAPDPPQPAVGRPADAKRRQEQLTAADNLRRQRNAASKRRAREREQGKDVPFLRAPMKPAEQLTDRERRRRAYEKTYQRAYRAAQRAKNRAEREALGRALAGSGAGDVSEAQGGGQSRQVSVPGGEPAGTGTPDGGADSFGGGAGSPEGGWRPSRVQTVADPRGPRAATPGVCPGPATIRRCAAGVGRCPARGGR
jgi:hypothetical protein